LPYQVFAFSDKSRIAMSSISEPFGSHHQGKWSYVCIRTWCSELNPSQSHWSNLGWNASKDYFNFKISLQSVRPELWKYHHRPSPWPFRIPNAKWIIWRRCPLPSPQHLSYIKSLNIRKVNSENSCYCDNF